MQILTNFILIPGFLILVSLAKGICDLNLDILGIVSSSSMLSSIVEWNENSLLKRLETNACYS
jgi:hypothetical protein